MADLAVEWHDFIPPSAADKIATEIANLPWAQGNSVEEVCCHHGEIQEIIAKHSPPLPSADEIARVLFHAESEPHKDRTGYGDVYGWDDVMPAVRNRHRDMADAILALFSAAEGDRG